MIIALMVIGWMLVLLQATGWLDIVIRPKDYFNGRWIWISSKNYFKIAVYYSKKCEALILKAGNWEKSWEWGI